MITGGAVSKLGTASSLTMGSSLKGAIVSRLMYLPRCTARSSF